MVPPNLKDTRHTVNQATEGLHVARRMDDSPQSSWGCYVIAEAGSNHNGDLKTALQLVRAASDSGADAVKFQLFRASDLYPANCGVVDLPSGPADFFDLLSRLELPDRWLEPLHSEAERNEIAILFSVFSTRDIDLLAPFDPPAFKVASPEVTHLPLLEVLAAKHRLVIVSTGMSSLADVEEVINIFKDTPRDLVLLHCTSSYPCMPSECNLAAMITMRDAFGTTVGYSDHTLHPTDAPVVATGLGARYIEKHFTLSRDSVGPDHPFSLEPHELATMVRAIRQVSSSGEDRYSLARSVVGKDRFTNLLGSSCKRPSPSEMELWACDRRSLHATADIDPGDVLTSKNVSILRGERNLRPGLHPRFWPVIDGAVTHRAIAYGLGITWDDLVIKQT